MKKIILFVMLSFFLLPNLVSAVLNVGISIKDSFSIGEKVSFDYTLTSDISQNITFLPHITCPNAPIALLQEKTIQLQAGKPYTDTYTNIKVEDWIEPQTCTAYVRILNPVQQYVSKNFTIATNPSFSFNTKTCKDSSCRQKAKIFYLGEKIYFDYDASVENPSISATLIYPDKTTKQVNLPSTTKAEQIGTYELDVTASKQGYKTITTKEQFGVIKEVVSISYTEPRDETVETGEGAEEETSPTASATPLPTAPGNNKKDKLIYFLVAGLVIIIIFIILLVIKRFKK